MSYVQQARENHVKKKVEEGIIILNPKLNPRFLHQKVSIFGTTNGFNSNGYFLILINSIEIYDLTVL
jgi:hypothetical protein